MLQPVFVYDPTVKDKLSKTRGVGRYLQILRENFSGEFKFIHDLRSVDHDYIFINPFFNFLQPPLTLKRIAKKQVAVIHDLIPLKYPDHFPAGIRGGVNIFLSKLALKNYDLIITDSQASKKDIIQMLKIDEKKVKVIYPCLPRIFTENNLKSQISNLKSTSKIDDFCLYVGDATWNKNLVNLTRAIKIINITCVFVGKVFDVAADSVTSFLPARVRSAARCRDPFLSCHLPPSDNGWQKELKDFLNEIKNDKRFVLAGFLTDNQLIKLYQQARANILVSRDEGFGFSYIEAAYNKCPSVLSNISVLKEISDGQGLFADCNDPNEIANKIGEIYFNNQLRDKLGFEAQQQVKKYTSSSFKKDWLAALNSS